MSGDELDATPEHFAKIYGTILDSSIWEEPHHTVRVWITMLVMADPQGVVSASYSGLRRRSGVTMEELAEALEVLEGPDTDSRNPDHEGRRVVKIKGGWFIYNAKEYRDLRTKDQLAAAERAKRFRDKRKGNVTGVTDSVTSNGSNGEVRPEGEREGEVEVDNHSLSPAEFRRDREIEARPWNEDGIILRFCRMQENPEAWQHLLDGFQQGLGLPTGRATDEQIAQACLEAEALQGDMNPRRFRRVLQMVMEKPEERRKGPRGGGSGMLRAAEIITIVRKHRNPMFPNSVSNGWQETLSEQEIRVVNAFGPSRILGEEKQGIVLAQLAKMLGEVE